MFSSVSIAAGDEIPLIASSSSSAILHPPTRCDWATPPPLATCNLPYHPPPPDDLRFVSPLLAWPVDGAGGSGGEILFLPPDWSGGGDIGAEGGGDPGSTRGLSLTLAATSTAKLGSVRYPKLLSVGGGSLQDVVVSTGEAAARLREELLGPFTGYAAILRSSRFSGPAQQLLDDFCVAVTGGEVPKRESVGEASLGVSSTCGYRVMGAAKESESRRGNRGASTSSVHNSADAVGDHSDCGGGGSKIHRLEFQQKKAKLEQMQEEVGRKYKQYRQQMQMVVSSFELVAGLNSASPYTSLALKAISKHFMSLKNAISDRLQHINKVVGEELVSLPSSSRGDNKPTTSQLKHLDHSLGKQKSGETTASFMEDNKPPVWKPQRGLPERAVSVLRAWLFEHFLHPYPTDSDKHMLATQTGLSRNQVSNWFINARVRLWKPMIEEMHMLETNEASGLDLNSAKVREHVDGANSNCEQRIQARLDCVAERSQNPEPWHADKRSRAEGCEMVTSMDDGLMNFATHHQHAMDKVSLTLGLRHGGGQQNPQQMMMSHFGTQQINVP